MQNLYLTENEQKALRILANRGDHIAVRNECVIPLSGMGFFTSEIRRKTGIRDTLDSEECRAYLERYENALTYQRWDPLDNRLVSLFLQKNTFTAIASRLKAEGVVHLPGDIGRDLDLACEKAGIFTRDEKARRVQLKIYLTAFYLTKKPEKLSPHNRKAMELFASGMTIRQIAFCMQVEYAYAQYLVQSTCKEVGIVARGRGLQQKLARVFLASKNAPEELPSEEAEITPVTMDDPAF